MTTKYEVVNSANITTDIYQKPRFNPRRAQKIAGEWNEILANEPKLAYRDGKYYCVDGQHTIAARKIRNGGKELDIRCKVYYDMTYENGAWIYAHQQDNVKRICALHSIRALYEAKEPDVIKMLDLTNSLGIEMNFSPNVKEGKINCIDTALQVYRKHGSAKYFEIMTLIRDTWGGTYPCYHQNIVRGVTEFYIKYGERMNRAAFVRKLGAVHPVILMRNANARVGSKHKMCDEICDIYNKRLQNKLEG